MSRKSSTKAIYSFDIPEDFEEKFDDVELYESIRDNKKIYALTTFARAVPSFRDGLIEAYRRSLYDLIDKKVRHNGKTVKSALIVGDIIGRFHPHGDSSAYQGIVTLSQPWTNNEPLIYGQGNWGNVLGKSAASYRYTECKTSEFFDDVCEDIKREYVDFIPNFDDSDVEVKYIPFKIPVILVNGSYGIADAYMTSILPHNLSDVVDLCEKYIHNKKISNALLVDGFFPDFPNYGIILNKSEIEAAYKYNIPGNVKMKATIEVDRAENRITIKDLPYNVCESDVQNILKQQNEKQHAVLSKVYNLIDVKTQRDGELHVEYDVVFDKNSNILEIARDLEKICLSKTIPLNTIMFDDYNVRRVCIKDIVAAWYDTIYTTKLRRIGYLQTNLKTQIHILEGKLKIYDHVDEIIDFAKKNSSESVFIRFLSDKYGLTDIQANAIINMKISQLNQTSKDEIQEQIDINNKKIEELDISAMHIDDAIIEDLEFLRKKYGRPRRTVILDDTIDASGNIESIPMSNGAILWTHNQYAIFDIQNIINGKTLTNGIKTCKVDGKNNKDIIGCHNINNDLKGILIFYKDGTAKKIPIAEIFGTNNWVVVDDEPVIQAIVPITSDNDKYIIISDSDKIRMVNIDQFGNQKVTVGKIKLAQRYDNTKDYCFITTSSGRYHLIQSNDIPELGRSAAGVMINLPDNDTISMVQIERFSDDVGICSVIDPDGYSYILKAEQELLEDTNRVNKTKKLYEFGPGYSISNVSLVNTKDKNSKCVLIGRNSISQISMQNIRASDMTKIPKKVPVLSVGIVTYSL